MRVLQVVRQRTVIPQNFASAQYPTTPQFSESMRRLLHEGHVDVDHEE